MIPFLTTHTLLTHRMRTAVERALNQGGGVLFLRCFLLGAVGTFSLAPYHILICLFISFGGLYYSLAVLSALPLPRGIKIWRGFVVAWVWGFGYFTASLYWIAVSLTVDLDRFWGLIPFSVLGVPALLSLFWGAGGAILARLNFSGAGHLIGAVLIFSGIEWIRGHVLTGFPWALMGYGFLCIDALAQGFSVIGAYGMTFVAFLLASSAALFLIPVVTAPKYTAVVFPFAVLMALGAMTGVGHWRLITSPSFYVPNVIMRLVQPAIPQSLKWDPDLAAGHFDRLIALSAGPDLRAGFTPTHVIWPESATSYYLEQDSIKRRESSNIVPPGGLLLTGTIRLGRDENRQLHARNSLIVIDGDARIRGIYDKSHLVPFGEYVPLRSVIPGIVQKITHGAVDYEPGPGIHTVTVPTLPPFSPLICYEGIFPGRVVADPNAQWLLNITNDGWFGDTSGPYQHLDINRARAIEEGIPLVRAANTGISAVIDGYGRTVCRLDLNAEGVLDSRLPQALTLRTLYSRFHDGCFFILWGIFAVFGIFVYRKSKKTIY